MEAISNLLVSITLCTVYATGSQKDANKETMPQVFPMASKPHTNKPKQANEHHTVHNIEKEKCITMRHKQIAGNEQY